MIVYDIFIFDSLRGTHCVKQQNELNEIIMFYKCYIFFNVFQDSIDKDEMEKVLKKVSDDNYESYFQMPTASTDIKVVHKLVQTFKCQLRARI